MKAQYGITAILPSSQGERVCGELLMYNLPSGQEERVCEEAHMNNLPSGQENGLCGGPYVQSPVGSGERSVWRILCTISR